MAKFRTLRFGSEGEDVVHLHFLLEGAGVPTKGQNWAHLDTFSKKTRDGVIYFQQTHLASDSVALSVDGVVGPNTWWALNHQSGTSQRSFIKPQIPTGLSEERKRYLLVALSEHEKGVREKPNGSNRSKEVDKYIPQWWLDKHDLDDKGMPWCCFFVSWCDKTALGHYTLGRRHGSCRQAMNAAIKKGIWECRESSPYYVPRPGDWFIMLYGKGKGHIGIVLRVSKDGKRINTVEGNYGNHVKVGLREIDEKIVGFVNPFGDRNRDPIFTRGIRQIASVGKDSVR